MDQWRMLSSGCLLDGRTTVQKWSQGWENSLAVILARGLEPVRLENQLGCGICVVD
jgi:hypothetical protein